MAINFTQYSMWTKCVCETQMPQWQSDWSRSPYSDWPFSRSQQCPYKAKIIRGLHFDPAHPHDISYDVKCEHLTVQVWLLHYNLNLEMICICKEDGITDKWTDGRFKRQMFKMIPTPCIKQYYKRHNDGINEWRKMPKRQVETSFPQPDNAMVYHTFGRTIN